jgi:hypothetical protein
MTRPTFKDLARGLMDEMRSAVHHHENIGKGGQQVSYHGWRVTPSVVMSFKWWLRELDDALAREELKEEADETE